MSLNTAGMLLWEPQLLSLKVPAGLAGTGGSHMRQFPRHLGVLEIRCFQLNQVELTWKGRALSQLQVGSCTGENQQSWGKFRSLLSTGFRDSVELDGLPSAQSGELQDV